MTFRKESRNSMRLTVALLSWVMAFQGIASGQARPGLKIVVVEGEGTNNDIETGSAQPPVVQVRDDNDQPVAGANVVFALPQRGPGGTFFGVWNNMTVTTNEQGRATGNGFRANQTEGRFQIQVTAQEGDRTGTINITQNNVRPPDDLSRVVDPIRRFGHRKLIVGLAAGAIAGIVLAARGGNNSSSTTTPGTSITPGTISVGTPR